MPALFTFLFKVNIALVLFCIGYYLVLRHLTFYTLNRVYLVTAMLFSSFYPWIRLDGFMERHQQLAAPVQTIIMQWRSPAENLVKPLNQPSYWLWAEAIFWTGAAFLAIRLIMQLVSLYRLHQGSKRGKVHNYAVRLINGNVSPFSFWRNIYVNPDKISPSDLEKVLEHEHVHVSEWHTLDILLAELSTIFYWFNPGIWLMKKAVRENVEFITDRKILQKGVDTKQYQYSLLSVSMVGTPNSLVNNFNISTIKKRIIMMNAKRSSQLNLGRYMFVAPAVIMLLLVFGISNAEVAKKHFTNTLKSITLALKGASITSDQRPTLHPVSKQTGKVITTILDTNIKLTLKTADTIYAGKSRDGKKSMLLTSDRSVDSIAYVINGAKATREDLNALDPSRIKGLDLISTEQAKKFIDFMINKSDILFVTTDDSETGKKLKERIDKFMGRTLHTPGSSSSGSGKVTDIQISSSDTAPAASSNVKISTTKSSDVLVGSANVTAVVVGSGRSYVVTGTPITTVRINGLDVAPNVNLTDVVIDSAANNNLKLTNRVYVTGIRQNNAAAATGPLIIVDGKVTKSLKLVSPESIKSIVILKDKDATAYGDKAKNGVIVITTKKQI